MAKLEDDLLYKLLITGKATADDQQHAAKWIADTLAALQRVKDHCAGDALSRWDNGMRTTNSRGFIMDVCDVALGNVR